MNNDEIANLRALRPTDINPSILLQTLRGNLHKIDKMYVVTFDDKGIPTMYGTSDKTLVPAAALYMQEMFLNQLMARK